MGTSFEINLAGMVATQSAAVADGTFKGGTEWKPALDAMWLLKAGSNGDHNPSVIPAETWAKFLTVWRDISSRTIDVASLVK